MSRNVSPWKRIWKNYAMIRNYRRNLRWFKPLADDIIIVGYPRSGLTWLQMILYQLTTDGQLGFENFADVSPSLEFYLMYEKPEMGSLPSPRLIRSHLPYDQIPKGSCKYIYLARDGRDVAAAHFHRSDQKKNGNQEFSRYFARFLKGRVRYRSWYQHVNGWYGNKHQLDLLFLTYEELGKDGDNVLRRIAQHIGLEADESLFAHVHERSSTAFMRANEAQLTMRASAQGSKDRFVHMDDSGTWHDYFDDSLQTAHAEQTKKVFAATGLDPVRLHVTPKPNEEDNS